MLSFSTLLSNIPANKLKELEIVVQRIADSGNAEIIHLFGSYARGDFKPELYEMQPKKSDFDLLIVTADKAKKEAIEAEFLSTYAFKDVVTLVQLVVETIDTVNRHLENNQFFYTDIAHEGKTLFDSGKVKFAEAKKFTITKRREVAEQEFAKWYKNANGFYLQHKHAINDNYFGIAAFNLQQAVEFAYKTVELVCSQYMPHEHYLSLLRRRAETFDLRMSEPFPQETKEQRHLFDHLDLAYIGGRYMSEEEYTVTKEQLDYWDVEVQKLLAITEVVCKEKIEKFRARE